MREVTSSKRGQVDLVLTGVIVLFIAGFLFIMGLIILDELMLETADTTGRTDNETLSSVTEKGVQVANRSLCGFSSVNVIWAAVTNTTDNLTISTANYSVSDRSGNVYFSSPAASDGSTVNNTDWLVTYTYSYGGVGGACEATNKSISGQGKFGDYVDLIALAIVIAVIMSLILAGFAMKKVR